MRWALRPFFLVLVVSSLPSVAAHARAGADSARIEEARRHFEVARSRFMLGDYAGALSEFDAAYALDPRPLLLYNAGLAARSAGVFDVAQDRLRRFLREAPHGRERQEALIYLAELKERAARSQRSGGDSLAPSPQAGPSTATPPAAARAADQPAPTTGQPAPAAGQPVPTASQPAAPAAEPPVPASPGPSTAPVAPSGRPAVATAKHAPPLYRRWWLWTTVTVAAVGVGVGLGVGLTAKPWSPNLPPVTLHSSSLMFRF